MSLSYLHWRLSKLFLSLPLSDKFPYGWWVLLTLSTMLFSGSTTVDSFRGQRSPHRHTAGPVESEGVEMPKMSPVAKSRAASCSMLLCIIGHRTAVASGALKAPQGGTLWLTLPTLFSWALLVKKQNQNTVKACLKDKCFALGYVQTANTLCIIFHICISHRGSSFQQPKLGHQLPTPAAF